MRRAAGRPQHPAATVHELLEKRHIGGQILLVDFPVDGQRALANQHYAVASDGARTGQGGVEADAHPGLHRRGAGDGLVHAGVGEHVEAVEPEGVGEIVEASHARDRQVGHG